MIPPCWGGAGTFPVADVGAHVGGWGERSRLGCEMTHVVEAGSYLQLFLFCQKTSGLSSPFTVAPNKQLPNREAAKRTACIQQRGLKIQSTSSAKGVAQQTKDPGARRRGALQEWSRRDGACRAVLLHAGGGGGCETSRATERLREIIHNLFPHNVGHVHLIHTISFIPGYMSK